VAGRKSVPLSERVKLRKGEQPHRLGYSISRPGAFIIAASSKKKIGREFTRMNANWGLQEILLEESMDQKSVVPSADSRPPEPRGREKTGSSPLRGSE